MGNAALLKCHSSNYKCLPHIQTVPGSQSAFKKVSGLFGGGLALVPFVQGLGLGCQDV